MEGGYAYIDTSYPRRPGDIAKLSSPEFDATGNSYHLVEECHFFRCVGIIIFYTIKNVHKW